MSLSGLVIAASVFLGPPFYPPRKSVRRRRRRRLCLPDSQCVIIALMEAAVDLFSSPRRAKIRPSAY